MGRRDVTEWGFYESKAKYRAAKRKELDDALKSLDLFPLWSAHLPHGVYEDFIEARNLLESARERLMTKNWK